MVCSVCLQAQGLSPAQKTALRGAAFVPVANGTRLVAPEHMFSRLQLDLAPFAFEVSRIKPQVTLLPGHEKKGVYMLPSVSRHGFMAVHI